MLDFVLAYLIGSIPFGLIIGFMLGHGDIRDQGSGNIGATNAVRHGGKVMGGVVLILDGLKGILSILLISKSEYIGIMVVLGHIFPIWLMFNGGKGVATSIFTLFALDYEVAIVLLLIWILILLKYKNIGIASCYTAIMGIVYSIIFVSQVNIFLYIIMPIIIIRHKKNIDNYIIKYKSSL